MTKATNKSNKKAVRKTSSSNSNKPKETAETRILRALAHEYSVGNKTQRNNASLVYPTWRAIKAVARPCAGFYVAKI